MTKYTIGQELVVAPMGYGYPIVLTVTKVGTKYVAAKTPNGVAWKIIKATGLSAQGHKVWPSREAFEADTAIAKRINRIKAMISKFEWSKCSMAELDAIEAAFNKSEGQAQLKATMRRIGMVP